MLMVRLPKILKNELGRYIIRAFKYTYNVENRQFKKSTGAVGINLDYYASNLLRQLHDGILRTDSFYHQFTGDLGTELDKVLAESFIEDTNLDAMIDRVVYSMQRKINLSIGRATRIARTELIHVSNEARLKVYQQRMAETGEEYNFTLSVARGNRTCEAHKELARRIPKAGLPLSELIELQIEVGKKYFGSSFTLQGHAMMHPNQRTVLVRQV